VYVAGDDGVGGSRGATLFVCRIGWVGMDAVHRGSYLEVEIGAGGA
jgi:hypothetical protein